MIIIPRQARDKYRESTQIWCVFLQATLLTFGYEGTGSDQTAHRPQPKAQEEEDSQTAGCTVVGAQAVSAETEAIQQKNARCATLLAQQDD